jgi:thymidylate synthase
MSDDQLLLVPETAAGATLGTRPEDEVVDARIDSVDLAYREALLAVLLDGAEVTSTDEDSVGGGRKTRERRNYSLEVPHAADRIVTCVDNYLRPMLAVGRFLWMMAGSDRLDDIRFYETKGLAGDRTKGVGGFSDDGLSVPGSDYGSRLFRPRPGTDQVAACVRLIRNDPNTRRAAMTVYQPEDAGRVSSDIPCTFGVLLSPRDSTLHLTVVMRSNNAWFLLPYNIFEFTLLGEIIASETGLRLGTYHHFAISMHLYESDWERARLAVGAPALQLEPFPEMPPNSLSRVRELCIWESRIRFEHRGLNKRQTQAEIRRLRPFGEYWEPFGRVVLAKALLNAQKNDLAEEVARATSGPLGQLLRREMKLEGEIATNASRVPEPSSAFVERIQSERQESTADRRQEGQFWKMLGHEKLREGTEAADHRSSSRPGTSADPPA